jgi:hypothetical protein
VVTLSRFLWTVAIGCGLVCLSISIGAGRTPLTELLFAVAALAGGLGIGVDRVRR